MQVKTDYMFVNKCIPGKRSVNIQWGRVMSSGTKEGNQQDSLLPKPDIAGQFQTIILAIKSISSVLLSLSQPVK